MSIATLLEDAGALWKADRKIGAFVLVLVTVSATARKRYPRGTRSWKDPQKDMSDSEAFMRFVLDEMDKITGGPKYNVAFPFLGKDKVPLEEILYTHLRCQLVHEAAMPDSIYLTPTEKHGDRIQHVLKLTQPLGFPEGWINNLAVAVRMAPENSEEFDSPAN
ncbi:MAG: hypothetical protein L0312_29320 [Acidobacteria bacterium]|nr:hypothetical protein [Acidobacteriota bacterium]